MMLINKILNTLKNGAGFKSAPLAVSMFWGVVVLMFAFTFSSYAAWTSPTADPPEDNVDAPINTGSTLQYKSGALGVGGVLRGYSASYFATSGGNVGIGTTAPEGKLHVYSASAGVVRADPDADELVIEGALHTGISILAPSTSYVASLYFGSAADHDAGRITYYPAGNAMYFFTNSVERMRINNNGNVGIGTTTPGAKLDVAGNVIIGVGGTGKLTVGTIDPVYTIGGIKYATYVSGMIGQKEDTTDVVQLVNGRAVLDFKNAKKGSNLWLFAKASALHENFDKLVVLLTPAFNGDVWYEKDAENLTVTIYGLRTTKVSGGQTLEVSYRLTSPRFDWAQWTNYPEDAEGIDGFIID